MHLMVAQQAGVHSKKVEGSGKQIYHGSTPISQFGVRAQDLVFNYPKRLKNKCFFNQPPKSCALTPTFACFRPVPSRTGDAFRLKIVPNVNFCVLWLTMQE
jgi:hypothetical protein